MDKMSHRWRDIGQLVGVSIGQLDSISTKHREDPVECVRDVLGKWMENPPEDYPNTWSGLVELLNDCHLSTVADDLKTALSKAGICQLDID